MRKRALRTFLFCLLFVLVPPFVSGSGLFRSSAGTAYAEERSGRIRAALLYYIAKFVRFQDESGSSLEICAMGEDPLNEFLAGTVAGKSTQRRALRARLLRGMPMPSELQTCQILFIGHVPQQLRTDILIALHQRGSLSVCAVDTVTWGTCMIQIFASENRLRLAIDREMTESAGIRVSSELLEVAQLSPRPETNGATKKTPEGPP